MKFYRYEDSHNIYIYYASLGKPQQSYYKGKPQDIYYKRKLKLQSEYHIVSDTQGVSMYKNPSIKTTNKEFVERSKVISPRQAKTEIIKHIFIPKKQGTYFAFQ